MSTMEFSEIKRIWDSQSNQPLYILDERAMHNIIRSKTGGERRLASMREWSTILFYLGAAGLMLGVSRFNLFKPGANIFVYLSAAWLIGTVVYTVVSRTRRIKSGRRFDRSILGDLDHAIWVAGYQMRYGVVIACNFLPMGVLAILFSWDTGRLFMTCVVVVLVAGALTFFVERKVYRASNKRRHALEVLKGKLESED